MTSRDCDDTSLSPSLGTLYFLYNPQFDCALTAYRRTRIADTKCYVNVQVLRPLINEAFFPFNKTVLPNAIAPRIYLSDIANAPKGAVYKL